jgi:hypothetical protein
MEETATWSIETSQFLSERSQRASVVFHLIRDASFSDSIVTKLDGSSVQLYGLVRERFQLLLAQLGNLRSIMEKPEVYF